MRKKRTIIAASAAFLCAVSAAAVQQAVVHTPVTQAISGAEVPLEVTLVGFAEGTTVQVHHRLLGNTDHKTVELVANADGVYAGVLPASSTTGLGLRYHVEVRDAGGALLQSVGTAKAALPIQLVEPTVALTDRVRSEHLGLLAALALVAMWIRSRSKRRAAELIEHLFWTRSLAHLLELPADGVVAAVRRLSGTPLQHPVKGLTIFSRKVLWQRLREVGEIDQLDFERQCKRYLDPQQMASVRGPVIREHRPPSPSDDQSEASRANERELAAV